MWEAKHLMVAVDFNSIFSILRKLMATVNCLVTNILPNIFFCAQQTKEIYRFETTWGRRSDKSYIFGLIIRLNS